MLNISKHRVNDQVMQEFELHSLDTLSTPRTAIILKRWLTIILVVLLVVLFLPWQQNINGKGDLTTLTPQDRPQNIQNAIAGRIERWHVREGQLVAKGDTLIEISEIKDDYFDPNLPLRLQEQVTAKNDAIASYQSQVGASDNQISALKANLQFSLQKARNKVKQGMAKVISDSTDVEAEKLQLSIAQTRLDRGEDQLKEGIVSLNEVESRRLKLREVQAKVVSLQNKLIVSRQELINARIELSSVEADYQEKIAKASSDRSKALSSLADGENELSKLKNKATNVEVRRSQYVIRAPQNGYVVKTLKAGVGETIKEGESIIILQPSSPQKAVEMYIRATDVPLVKIGDEVRLQFDGWPALVFSGWPSVTVGTFGGTVNVIDMVNSKNGEYRILVTPKKGSKEEDWPKQLRIGSGVYGWVMLRDVPVWYEIWRQLNAFPPNLTEEPKDETTKKEK
ncbi:MAG: HlyD family efflux transporter periplasmic adaptor subunit [Spirosomataceae bacterium]